jgi:hypothetical protein
MQSRNRTVLFGVPGLPRRTGSSFTITTPSAWSTVRTTPPVFQRQKCGKFLMFSFARQGQLPLVDTILNDNCPWLTDDRVNQYMTPTCWMACGCFGTGLAHFDNPPKENVSTESIDAWVPAPRGRMIIKMMTITTTMMIMTIMTIMMIMGTIMHA